MKYGRLTIIGEKYMRLTNSNSIQKRTFIKAKCDCGIIKEYHLEALKRGLTMSCGCLRNERIGKARITHGLTYHRLYSNWRDILNRCYNKNVECYKYYGGRGITVCDEWRKDFLPFYNWSMANGWKRGLTIDRFPNNDDGYNPNNCRWITLKENVRNSTHSKLTLQRANHIRLLYRTGNKSQKEIGNLYGVTKSAINSIIRNATWT